MKWRLIKAALALFAIGGGTVFAAFAAGSGIAEIITRIFGG